MNKKTILLTASLVSLFLGGVLLIFGHNYKFLLVLGAIVLTMGLVLYLIFKNKQTDEIITGLSSEEIDDEKEQIHITRVIKRLKTRRLWTSVYMGILAIVIILAVIIS